MFSFSDKQGNYGVKMKIEAGNINLQIKYAQVIVKIWVVDES